MQIIEKIKECPPKILVIGDIMLDRFIFGNVYRISPEAPVPIVQSLEEKFSLGGCGNVVRNLINLGVQAFIVSFVGSFLKVKIFDIILGGIVIISQFNCLA